MQPKKVIIVDDDKMLVTLLKMFLEEMGYEVIGIFSDGRSAIDKCKIDLPDVILMDIHLEGDIDGIRTVDIIKTEFDIPVIFITSDTNEGLIARAIHTNPYGFLLKPIQKSTLGITLELAYYKHRHEKEIELREKPYRKLVDDSENTIIILINDVIEFVNVASMQLFETINIEDLLQKSIYDFIPESQTDLVKTKFFKALKNNGKIDNFNTQICSLNKKIFDVGVVGSTITYKKQKALQIILTDKTEEIQSKKLLSEQDNIINNLHDGVITLALNGTIKTYNNGAERIFGLSRNNALNNNVSVLFPGKDESMLQEQIIEYPLEKEFYEIEFSFIHPQTNVLTFTLLSLTVMKNHFDEITGIICYCSNVTDKKKHEEALKTSNNNLKAIFNGGTEAIFLIDQNLCIIDYNKLAHLYAKEIFSREVSAGAKVLETLNFLPEEEFLQLFANTKDGVTHYLERQFLFAELKKYLKITIYPIIDDSIEQITRFCISFLDITERKKTEKDLEDSRAELKPLFDSSIQRFYLADLNFKLIAFNRAAKEQIQKELKYSLKRGDNILDFVSKDSSLDEFKQKFERAKNGEHVIFKEQLKIDELNYYNEVHLDPIANFKGEIYRILVWTLDITERENNMIAMKQSEERYFLVSQAGNDGIWDWNLATDEMFLTPRWKSMLGFTETDNIGRRDARDKLIHPDDVAKVKQKLTDYLEGKTDNYFCEYRIKNKQGEFRWVSERALLLRDDSGKPIRIAGAITDVTDRKVNEERIESAHKILLEERSMFIKGNVLVFRADAQNTDNINYVSDNVANVLGYTPEDFINKKITLSSLIHPDDYDMHIKERVDVLKRDATHVEFTNYRLTTKSGKICWVKDFTSIIRNEKGEAMQLLGYMVDITKEKMAEQKYQESQLKYYALFTEANDAILVIDSINDTIVDCNNKALEMFGYSREEFQNFSFLTLSPDKQPNGKLSRDVRQEKVDEAMNNGHTTFYWQQKKKNNTLFDAEVSLTVVNIGNKKYRHAIIRDISERIKIEKSLRESEEKNRALLKAIPDIIFLIDKNGTYLDFKADYYSKFFVPKENIIGLNHKHYFQGDKLNEILSKIKKAIETNEVQTIEYQLNSPIGMRWFEARLSPLNDNEVLSLVRDVTDKVESKVKI